MASDLLVVRGRGLLRRRRNLLREHLHPPGCQPRRGEKLLALFDWWKEYARKHGGTLDDNPSAGNKAGGITTILEKSLGAAAKAGATNLVDVYRYAETVTARGFVFMDTPGFDPVSATGRWRAGQPDLFTTDAVGLRLCPGSIHPARATYSTSTIDGRRHGTSTAAVVDGTEWSRPGRAYLPSTFSRLGRSSRTGGARLREAEFAPWPSRGDVNALIGRPFAMLQV